MAPGWRSGRTSGAASALERRGEAGDPEGDHAAGRHHGGGRASVRDRDRSALHLAQAIAPRRDGRVRACRTDARRTADQAIRPRPDRNPAQRRLYRVDRRAGRQRSVEIGARGYRSEEHTSELQSLMRTSYAVFCLKKKKTKKK